MKRLAVILALGLAGLVLCSCDVSVDSSGLDMSDPLRRAEATATVSAVQAQDRHARLDIAIRQTAAAQEVAARQAAMEATRQAVEADTTARLIVAPFRLERGLRLSRHRGRRRSRQHWPWGKLAILPSW